MKKVFTLLMGFALMAMMIDTPIFAEDKSLMKGSGLEDKGSAGGEMDPAMAAMMQKWQEYSTPGESHQVLDKLVGEWNHSLKMWMDPNAPAEESTGTSSTNWILDGRFIQSNVTGVSMGQPFAGVGITGYDNMKQKYTTIWMDNMGTGMMKGEGAFDAATNSITDEGSYSCPMIDGQRAYRSVLKFVDDNSYTYEMYTNDDEGNEYRSMIIEYTRKQS